MKYVINVYKWVGEFAYSVTVDRGGYHYGYTTTICIPNFSGSELYNILKEVDDEYDLNDRTISEYVTDDWKM